jgi:D-beta-D-heptose 7-phosphate kinase/D-beta-D-heptose 1-phosphate adenosyltransferase
MKKRVIASHQQLLRIDYEDTHAAAPAIRAEIVRVLESAIRAGAVDAIIYEDYNKGLLDAAMIDSVSRTAEAAGIAQAFDPHPGHELKINGLTVMTPNRAEAFAMARVYQGETAADPAGDPALREVAEVLRREWSPEYLLITLGAQGMALFDRGGGMAGIPTRAREVFDVSGAGDTVIAAFTLALLAGASGREAAEIANHAAGVVVGKVGTVTVSPDELRTSFREDRP